MIKARIADKMEDGMADGSEIGLKDVFANGLEDRMEDEIFNVVCLNRKL